MSLVKRSTPCDDARVLTGEFQPAGSYSQSKTGFATKLLVVGVAAGSMLVPELASAALDAGVAAAIDAGLTDVQTNATEVSLKVWTPLIAVTGITVVMGLFKRMAGKI